MADADARREAVTTPLMGAVALAASASSVAKIIRPVVVWITFRTRTPTWDPMRAVASSTTTIVPSSR